MNSNETPLGWQLLSDYTATNRIVNGYYCGEAISKQGRITKGKHDLDGWECFFERGRNAISFRVGPFIKYMGKRRNRAQEAWEKVLVRFQCLNPICQEPLTYYMDKTDPLGEFRLGEVFCVKCNSHDIGIPEDIYAEEDIQED